MFRAGGQLAKVRFIMWLMAASGAACLWFGWVLLQSYGLSPGDGGVLAPAGQRIGWFVGLGGLGLALIGGMALYGRLYVSRIDYHAAERRLHVRTLTYWGSRGWSFEAGAVARSTFHGGQLINPAGVSVKAPWHFLYLRGRRLPLIVDAQGAFADPRLAARLMKAG